MLIQYYYCTALVICVLLLRANQQYLLEMYTRVVVIIDIQCSTCGRGEEQTTSTNFFDILTYTHFIFKGTGCNLSLSIFIKFLHIYFCIKPSHE